VVAASTEEICPGRIVVVGCEMKATLAPAPKWPRLVTTGAPKPVHFPVFGWGERYQAVSDAMDQPIRRTNGPTLPFAPYYYPPPKRPRCHLFHKRRSWKILHDLAGFL
jgi:hypothetical protein